MQKNQLGRSELKISEIGLGCMSLGLDKKEAVALIHQALDLGINFFDTADLYEFGQNEEIVGAALKGRRSDIVLASKVGNRAKADRSGWTWDPSKQYIKSQIKESLRRLQTDYIDLYQLHGGTLDDPIEETIEAFEELVEEGYVRYYGISSIRPNVIREYVKKSNIVSVMIQYSILDRRAEEEVLPLLQQKGISAIVRGPVAKGALSERMPEKFTDGTMDYSQDELQDLHQLLQKLVLPERSLSQAALRYSLAHPAVASVIPGASRTAQLTENIAASEAPLLSHEEIRFILKHSKANLYDAHR